MVFKKIADKLKGEEKVVKGEETKDKTYSSENEFQTQEEAEKKFKTSVEKLFRINQWSELPGISSTFVLYDSEGKEKIAGKPERDDYIKIILPGPTPENWVVVTDIQEDDEKVSFTVSPSIDPTKKEEDQDKIEHFFIKEATSTFRLELKGKTIHAWEIGKNEGINNEEEDAGKRQLINTLIAEGGWAGVQALQWNKLTDYLVHKIEMND